MNSENLIKAGNTAENFSWWLRSRIKYQLALHGKGDGELLVPEPGDQRQVVGVDGLVVVDVALADDDAVGVEGAAQNVYRRAAEAGPRDTAVPAHRPQGSSSSSISSSYATTLQRFPLLRREDIDHLSGLFQELVPLFQVDTQAIGRLGGGGGRLLRRRRFDDGASVGLLLLHHYLLLFILVSDVPVEQQAQKMDLVEIGKI